MARTDNPDGAEEVMRVFERIRQMALALRAFRASPVPARHAEWMMTMSEQLCVT